MKNFVISFLFFILPIFSFSQTENYDSTKIIQEYKHFFIEYEKEMQTWPQDKIDYFNKTFVYTRGNFTIPNEEIVPYVPKN